MANIFLSYHKQHQKTAEKLRYALMYRGFTTWFIEDNNVDVPQEEMEKAIENASVVIMCMSTKYQASENCKKEIEYAERLNKPIIPILVESGFTPSGWLAVVSGSKTVIDFGDSWYFFESFEQLQEELAAKNINPNAVDSRKYRKEDDEVGEDNSEEFGESANYANDEDDKEEDNPQTGHIFLSYHNQHRKIAVKLRCALESRRFKTWFDRDDSEIEYAERLKKQIIPICVEYGFEPSGWLELASDSTMDIDFSDEMNFDEKFEQLLEELAAKNISIIKKRTGEIFISYHNEHQNTVMRLRGGLKSRGFTTWFDRDDTVKIPCKMTQSSVVQLRAKEVYGLTRLHDKLYVLSNSISIHRLQHPFTRVGEITTPEIKSPKYIASCSKTSCLYIHDSGEECVWKIAIPSRRVSRWLSEVKEPCALSVTSDAELLLLRNNKPVCLEVYNEHAILVQRSRLPGTFPLLQRICETPSGKFIGQGGQSMYIFTRNGSIISQFQPSNDPKYRGHPQCFNLLPYQIFLHCGSYVSSGYLKKSNLYCGTISSLTLDLASHQILVDKSHGWKTPVTSCYLKEAKQLLVLAEVVSGSDKTYSLRTYNVLPELGAPEICAKKLQKFPSKRSLFCAPKPLILRAHCAK